MNTIKNFLLILGLFSVVLTGCGTKEANNEQTNGTEVKVEENDKQEEAKEETEDNSSENEPIVRILEQNMTYTVNGQTKEETAFLKNSENQNYSMYVLPDYELTAEEPYKDSLYLTENDRIFMRIELLPDDMDLESAKDNMNTQLAAVNENVSELEPPTDEFFTDAIVYEATDGQDIVTGYLVQHDDISLKLTMFTSVENNHKETFLQMAKTILPKQ
ncbi:hypothetical protein LS684_07035 [Cytobacillus spongiae]|jgi:hypothetical protein|uniref:hypothetical protein n=1 Tax=Cytobacillus spongiae TaxID=2901381 RepID=UPI001F2AE76A|nr:hypothetical protein [Cytobacillus spongiae]UII57189.1 hypothetical protein LS684_07035 [Cytobacillus spongiae]